MATKYHARSISLPSRSHPSTSKVEEELRKVKTWVSSSSSSSSVCGGLLGLQDLYDSIDELLKMGSTQKVLSCPQHKQLVEELLDGSMKLLDVCSLAKEVTLETQQHVGALHSAVRRRKGDSAVKTATAELCDWCVKTSLFDQQLNLRIRVGVLDALDEVKSSRVVSGF